MSDEIITSPDSRRRSASRRQNYWGKNGANVSSLVTKTQDPPSQPSFLIGSYLFLDPAPYLSWMINPGWA